ncbi:ParA family protein [Lactococcus allomyrinae]|uniref:ParA family protein n=1 Tax=Lactococcus allomyrinae TaxID=2419773 RepID=A0A387BG61_9LACT|nr:ParA family protein [Lactococcus allomyrinae]AYG01132.1 ParA family protein [Lactococcus allomyrinae]
MKIMTITIHKGGDGKTTFTLTFASYLRQNSRVLVIDKDKSRNLTNLCIGLQEVPDEQSILGIYNNLEVQPIQIKENLDLIAGSSKTKALKKELVGRRKREEIFVRWIARNYEWLNEHYDYLLIDTENAQDELIENSVIASDMVLGIARPGDNSIIAINGLQNYVNEINQDYETQVKLRLIGNEIVPGETASKDFIETMQSNRYREQYLGYIKHSTAMNHSVPLFDRKIRSDQKAFAADVKVLCHHLKDALDN